MPKLSASKSLQGGTLPATGFVRQRQLLTGPAPVLPFSSATLWRRVQSGDFPRPVRLGPKLTAWRAEDVRAWIERQGASA